jgi:hypothetical protein
MGTPGIHGVVAEREGRVIGSNFLDERSTIAGVGPITVDPAVQDGGAGRWLMDAVLRRRSAASARALRRAQAEGFPAVRLVQAAYHSRSLALYTKLGFDAREELVTLQGAPSDALKALIAAAPEFGGPGFNLPVRNGDLFRWALDRGLRVVQTMTLMTRGLYNEPRSPYLPSILY